MIINFSTFVGYRQTDAHTHTQCLFLSACDFPSIGTHKTPDTMCSFFLLSPPSLSPTLVLLTTFYSETRIKETLVGRGGGGSWREGETEEDPEEGRIPGSDQRERLTQRP